MLLYRETESFRRVKQVDGKSLLIDPGKLESIFWMPSNKGHIYFSDDDFRYGFVYGFVRDRHTYIYIYTHTHF